MIRGAALALLLAAGPGADPPLEPLWSTGPRWLFGVVAGVLALFLWATCTPIVRGRDPWLAGIRLIIPLGMASVGAWILFGSRASLPVSAALAVALVGARRALGPARRPEDARAPGPVGWLGDVVFEIASFLVLLVVNLVVDIFLSALLGAIFGRGGGGGASGRGAGRSAGGSWGGGGGVFSGGGASGRW